MAKKARKKSAAKSKKKSKKKAKAAPRRKAKAAAKKSKAVKRKKARKAKPKSIMDRLAGAYKSVVEGVEDAQRLRNKYEPPGVSETE